MVSGPATFPDSRLQIPNQPALDSQLAVAATLVLHTAKLHERGHPFPKKVAVLEWHKPIWRVDG
jgi:hypothetical protein